MTSKPDEVSTIGERIARARDAKLRAKFALLPKTPVRDQPTPKSDGYFDGNYVGLIWRGKKIRIPKNQWGW